MDLPCKAFIITKPDCFGPVGSDQHLHGINIEHCYAFLGKIVQNVKEYRLAEHRGAFEKKRKLKLRASEEDNTFKCPVKYCDHEGFKTERGCRKHIKSRHGWYYFLDEKPNVQDLTKKVCSANNLGRLNKCRTHDIPSFSKDSEFAKDFCKWLTSMTGGSRPENQTDQIVSRALKFLKSVSSDDLSFEEVTDGIDIGFYLG